MDKEEKAKLCLKTLANLSPAQTEALKSAFEDEYDVSLQRTINRGFKGWTKSALLALLQPSPEWYASRLQAAFDGWGTCDKAVCRILGCNDKNDVQEIAKVFERKYQKPLKKAIEEECSGNYKRMCVAWISLPDLLEQPREVIDVPIEDVAEEMPEIEPETI